MDSGKFTTITLDRETKTRLEAAASDLPLATYLRQLSLKTSLNSTIEARLSAIENILKQRTSTPANLEDLIVETRELAQKLNYSKKRMETLDIFLAKAEPETISIINKDLREKINHPENFSEEYENRFFDEMLVFFKNILVPRLNREQLKKLSDLLAKSKKDEDR